MFWVGVAGLVLFGGNVCRGIWNGDWPTGFSDDKEEE